MNPAAVSQLPPEEQNQEELLGDLAPTYRYQY